MPKTYSLHHGQVLQGIKRHDAVIASMHQQNGVRHPAQSQSGNDEVIQHSLAQRLWCWKQSLVRYLSGFARFFGDTLQNLSAEVRGRESSKEERQVDDGA